MKVCKDCQQNKPFVEFYKNKKCKDGHHHKCVDCYRKDYIARREQRLGKEPKPITNAIDIKKAEIIKVSKLFTNGKVTVKAMAKVNGSLLNIEWPCDSNAEADRYIDQMYNNPVRMVQRYLERTKQQRKFD